MTFKSKIILTMGYLWLKLGLINSKEMDNLSFNLKLLEATQ